VEVRTRPAQERLPALPEMSITNEKREVLVRTAHISCGSGTSRNARSVSMGWPSKILPVDPLWCACTSRFQSGSPPLRFQEKTA
jgi:hypothetical protein